MSPIVLETLIIIAIDGSSNSPLEPFCIQFETSITNLWILDYKIWSWDH
jgi:hypothetical protein